MNRLFRGVYRSARAATAFAAIHLLAAAGGSSAFAQTPFYAGKQLTMVINFGPGSSTDIEGRLFARHIIKHIDGRPNLIVNNMPGAGGLQGTVYLGEIAPKDGSTFGFLTGAGWFYAIDPKRFKVDLKDYAFVGFGSTTSIYFIRSDVPPGIKTATDIAKADQFVSGGINPRAGRDFSIRVTLDMLGRKYKHVAGYGSGEKALLAIQRDEIQFYASTPPQYRSQIEPNLVKTGIVTPLFVDPSWDGKTLGVSEQVAGLGIMPFHELYQKIHGRMPSGVAWESYLTCVRLEGQLLRTLTFPPGTNKEAVAALSAAIVKLNKDPEFAADAQKALGFVPQYETGDAVSATIRDALTITPEVREFIAKFLEETTK